MFRLLLSLPFACLLSFSSLSAEETEESVEQWKYPGAHVERQGMTRNGNKVLVAVHGSYTTTDDCTEVMKYYAKKAGFNLKEDRIFKTSQGSSQRVWGDADPQVIMTRDVQETGTLISFLIRPRTESYITSITISQPASSERTRIQIAVLAAGK